ncbi:DUF5994 family protein [Mycolicibacterium sp. CBM1]
MTLNAVLGGEIDGAWWPHTSALARELPELIEALHPVLGEVVDMKLNWTAATRPPALTPLSAGSMSMLGWNDRRVRLMLIAGRTACARLLVVPNSAKVSLARTVSRLAASMPVGVVELDSPVLDTANCVISAAKAESCLWTASFADAGDADSPGR